MKLHTAKLADRYIREGKLYVRARIGNSQTIEVRVPDEQRAAAMGIYGNGSFNYRYSGGRAVMAERP